MMENGKANEAKIAQGLTKVAQTETNLATLLGTKTIDPPATKLPAQTCPTGYHNFAKFITTTKSHRLSSAYHLARPVHLKNQHLLILFSPHSCQSGTTGCQH